LRYYASRIILILTQLVRLSSFKGITVVAGSRQEAVLQGSSLKNCALIKMLIVYYYSNLLSTVNLADVKQSDSIYIVFRVAAVCEIREGQEGSDPPKRPIQSCNM